MYCIVLYFIIICYITLYCICQWPRLQPPPEASDGFIRACGWGSGRGQAGRALLRSVPWHDVGFEGGGDARLYDYTPEHRTTQPSPSRGARGQNEGASCQASPLSQPLSEPGPPARPAGNRAALAWSFACYIILYYIILYYIILYYII